MKRIWIGMAMMVMGLSVQASTMMVGMRGFCDNQLSAVEDAVVFSSALGQDVSCETVYVAPRKSETRLTKMELAPDLDATCQAMDESIKKQNALFDQLLPLVAGFNDPRWNEIMDAIDVEKANYDALAVKIGAHITFVHNTHLNQDIARLKAANPNVKVEALPLSNVKLNTGMLTSAYGLSKEEYLASVPGFLGGIVLGKEYAAWDNVKQIDVPDFGIQNDSLTITEIHSANSACVRRTESDITNSTLSIQGEYRANLFGLEVKENFLALLSNL